LSWIFSGSISTRTTGRCSGVRGARVSLGRMLCAGISAAGPWSAGSAAGIFYGSSSSTHDGTREEFEFKIFQIAVSARFVLCIILAMRLLNPSFSPDVNPCFTNPHTFSLCCLKPLASRRKGASLLADAMAHQFPRARIAHPRRL
jgi:hypothetical protein